MKKLILISGILCLVFTGLACQEQEEGVISYNNLEWKVGPDVDTDWDEANDWVESLGGDWRMPDKFELLDLYESGIKMPDDLEPFSNFSAMTWSSSPSEDYDSYYAFLFAHGFAVGEHKSSSLWIRALAVRNP